MTVILKLEYVSGRLIQLENLTGLVTRAPQDRVGLGQSLIIHLAIQVCFVVSLCYNIKAIYTRKISRDLHV